MQHPDSTLKVWGRIWFAKYALIFALPLLVLFIALSEHPYWLAGLGIYWFCSVAFLAWRAVNNNVRMPWRIGLGVVMTGFLSFMVVATFVPDGDTKICYDRIVQTVLRGPLVNLGPDPACDGIPLKDVQID